MRLACLFVCVRDLARADLRAPAPRRPPTRRPAKTKSTPKKSAARRSRPATENAGRVRSRRWPRTLRPGALTVNVGHEINEDAHVTPFPSFAGHAKKALAQNRRDQLIDAEQAARAARQPDRW